MCKCASGKRPGMRPPASPPVRAAQAMALSSHQPQNVRCWHQHRGEFLRRPPPAVAERKVRELASGSALLYGVGTNTRGEVLRRPPARFAQRSGANRRSRYDVWVKEVEGGGRCDITQ
eukprot:952460-Prymnesium_polylepis.2